MNWLKALLSVLIVAGLNQNLLLSMGSSLQYEKQSPMSMACACDPSACMCPPSRGCEHKRQGEKPTLKGGKQISNCRPATISVTASRDIPVLTGHSDSFTPYLLISYLDRLPAENILEQYPIPPEKPPQISFI